MIVIDRNFEASIEQTDDKVDLNNLKASPIIFRSFKTGEEMAFTSINSGHRFIEFVDGLKRWRDGELIQHAMPSWLSLDEREFCISGFTPEMWEGLA